MPVNDENVFISAACKEKGILFLQGKGTIGVRKCEKANNEPSEDSQGNEFTVTVNGKNTELHLTAKKQQSMVKLMILMLKTG